MFREVKLTVAYPTAHPSDQGEHLGQNFPKFPHGFPELSHLKEQDRLTAGKHYAFMPVIARGQRR